MSFSRKGIGVECYERVFGVVFFEREVQGEEAREVICVGYEGCPDWKMSVFIFRTFLVGF